MAAADWALEAGPFEVAVGRSVADVLASLARFPVENLGLEGENEAKNG